MVSAWMVSAWMVSAGMVLAACVGGGPAAEDIVITAPDSVALTEGHTANVPISAPVDFTVEVSGELAVAQTSDGASLRAAVGSTGGVITVHAGNAQKDIAVTVQPLAFQATAFAPGDPAAREHGALMASADGITLYLLAGGGFPNYPTQAMVDDAWQIDVATGAVSPWELHGDVPSALASRRVAPGPGDIVFLHGGYDANRRGSDELLQIDLSSGEVTLLTQSADRPLPRSLHAFGYDSASDRFIVSAGFYDSGLMQDILDDTWVGLFVPAGTPSVIVQQLNGAINQMLNQGDTRERLDAMAFEPVGGTVQQFDQLVKSEIAKWGKIVRDGNIKAD